LASLSIGLSLTRVRSIAAAKVADGLADFKTYIRVAFNFKGRSVSELFGVLFQVYLVYTAAATTCKGRFSYRQV
jgi:hypothetical protein